MFLLNENELKEYENKKKVLKDFSEMYRKG